MAGLLSARRAKTESPKVQLPLADPPGPEVVALPSGPVNVAWRRNARARRVSLRIDLSEGGVVVTLPPRASRKAGMALLMGNADWVGRRLAEVPAAMPLADGAEIPICGVPHRIRHRPDRRGGAWLEDGELHVTGDPAFLPRRAKDFLRAEAARRMAVLVRAKADAAGLVPGRIAVKDTTSRWGSCAPDKSLAFSWRLVMAPEHVQDYVAAHEVAHLRHMNHGPAFWTQVAALTAHTRPAIAWLKTQGPRLLRVR